MVWPKRSTKPTSEPMPTQVPPSGEADGAAPKSARPPTPTLLLASIVSGEPAMTDQPVGVPPLAIGPVSEPLVTICACAPAAASTNPAAMRMFFMETPVCGACAARAGC